VRHANDFNGFILEILAFPNAARRSPAPIATFREAAENAMQ
jgi:hypothetical protein